MPEIAPGERSRADLQTSGGGPPVLPFLCLLLCSFLLFASSAGAQERGELRVEPGEDLRSFEDKALDDVRVETLGPLWKEPIRVQSVRPGDTISGPLVRRALRELDRSGRYSELRAELVEDAGRLILVFWVRPRRLIEQIRWNGQVLDPGEESRALGLSDGAAVTDLTLEEARQDLTELYVRSGYPGAQVSITPEAVDDPMRVLLRVKIVPGPPQSISRVRFSVSPSPHHPDLGKALELFTLKPGERLDADVIDEAKEQLTEQLVAHHFYEAEVSHRTRRGGELEIKVRSGPRFRVRIEGNQIFGDDELEMKMGLSDHRDPEPVIVRKLLRQHYVKHGYLDAHVEVSRLDDKEGLRSELVVWIREGQRFRIARRLFPCLTGSRDKDAIDAEVDGVLSERFPPVSILGPPPADAVDAALGTPSATPRPTPWRAEPWSSFSDESYQAVAQHLQDLYRSEGYLDAQVGPATVVRRTCKPESPPGQCLVDKVLPLPKVECGAYAEPEKKVKHTCIPDPEAGVRCEADATLVLPIRTGQQAILYDVVVEGNEAFSEKELLELAELPVGNPLRRSQLEGALRRIQELYEEEAFAFAQIDSEIELSADHTRARLVISITERHQVRIARIDVRGASETSESLIRSRLALSVGDLYRRSAVQRSQEQVESLAVFTSVTIALEDPGVPAREKVVILNVAERLPQYLDISGGFGTADGFRIGFEYGHRNLGGEAIQLILRSQLALRPPLLIVDRDVRENYAGLEVIELLQRRNTITLAFPDVGLGPLFRGETELLDLYANNRDFRQTRDAVSLRLLFLPRRQYLVQLGGTVERNNAKVFTRGLNSPAGVLVPDGLSIAYTQNLSGSWDRRDQPLSAKRGTFLSAGIEHVTANPIGQEERQCDVDTSQGETIAQVCSEFLRLTGRLAGYIPLNKKGLTLALSFRGGTMVHLTNDSNTYPDRLFFMGGVDTIRGYTQWSLVPQDLAERIIEDDEVSINDILLRGGDVFVNPRAELRVPVTKTFQAGFFLDSGNLWYAQIYQNPLRYLDPSRLRYTAGAGVRVETPVGPLVFDYGFNLQKLSESFKTSSTADPAARFTRPWEDLGAFHFSIGLF